MTFKRVKTRGAPEWLYRRHLKNSSHFWIRYRKGGVYLEQPLRGETPRTAEEHGRKLLAEALGTVTTDMPTALIRCENLCQEIVQLKLGKSRATFEANEIMFRVHVVPYLNEHCAYISDLTPATWEHYKVFKRLENPNVALFNHWKAFVNLSTHAYKKGLIRSPLKFEFDEEREDFREAGQVIPDAELERILDCATQIWRDRIIVQRYTGMRPGEVRCLQKDRVDLGMRKIYLRKEDTKTRRAREFAVRSERLLAVLRRRMALESTFLFPARGRVDRPMEHGLKGWHAAMARAELAHKNYTPHDLRHTFLTSEFRKPGANPALICYAAGLSIEEAQETYLHFTADDTVSMADGLARESAGLRA